MEAQVAKIKSSTIHVEAGMETPRDAGSIPAASTKTGYTTRLDSNKARVGSKYSAQRETLGFRHVFRSQEYKLFRHQQAATRYLSVTTNKHAVLSTEFRFAHRAKSTGPHALECSFHYFDLKGSMAKNLTESIRFTVG